MAISAVKETDIIDNVKSNKNRNLLWTGCQINDSSTYCKLQKKAKKVLVIITGGTICMDNVGNDSSLKNSKNLSDNIFNGVEWLDSNLPQLTILQNKELIDSADMRPEIYISIAKDIQKYYKLYDGFVILHGTDTMAYTASMLSFMFENLDKPVILTGSMLSISNISTDAKKNMKSAFMYAAFSNILEVVIVFGSKIIRGNRSTKVDCFKMDAFDSPNYPHFGNLGISIKMNPKPNCKPIALPSKTNSLKINININMNILVICITPAINLSSIFQLSESKNLPAALVIQLFGCGTAPSNKSFVNTLSYLIKKGVVVAATTQCRCGSVCFDTYENGTQLKSIGVLNSKDMTIEAIVCKLAYLLGNGYNTSNIADLFEKNLRGEMTDDFCFYE